MVDKWRVALVLGIRPDFVRTSKVIKLLAARSDVELSLIHTGQHTDNNLNDVFFEQLEIPRPTHQLETRGKNHNEQHAKLILQLSDVLEKINPHVCVFLGDANAVMGCIAPLKLGIPIAHIEGGMRSYDWDMPEERNRVVIDRVSDVIYAYHDDYRVQLVQEGIPPHKIVVTGNVIVDVLKDYHDKFLVWPSHLSHLKSKNYVLVTLHRDEHMRDKEECRKILHEIGWFGEQEDNPVVLIEMPRLKALNLTYPSNFIISPPLGFFEFVTLEKNAAVSFTDSGTNQETASILGTPCVVVRRSSERPECNDCGTTTMAIAGDLRAAAYHVLETPRNQSFSLGDGYASQRIVDDLMKRLKCNFYRDTDPCFDTWKQRHFERFYDDNF